MTPIFVGVLGGIYKILFVRFYLVALFLRFRFLSTKRTVLSRNVFEQFNFVSLEVLRVARRKCGLHGTDAAESRCANFCLQFLNIVYMS